MTRAQPGLKLRAYSLVERAVEEGAAIGFRRAHKHIDDPDEQTILDHVTREVMSALCEVVDFGE